MKEKLKEEGLEKCAKDELIYDVCLGEAKKYRLNYMSTEEDAKDLV